MSARFRRYEQIALILLPVALVTLLVVSVAVTSYTQPFFVHTTYYFLLLLVLCWGGTYLYSARDLRCETVLAWLKANWPGVVVALLVTLIAWRAVTPALRILSDEANLVGTSKNLFASHTATFTVSGKNYYDSYWDIDVAIDRRPALFPFLVSLVHTACGYSYENVFSFNLLLLPAFVLVCYRLAKALGGETFGVVASLLVVAHPILLISVRSGGFEFFSVFFALLVLKSLHEHCLEASPARLARLWLNLCMFAEIRYETALFIPLVLALLLLFRMVHWNTLRPYAFVYALTPAYLLPRIWQAILRGNVPEQDPGTITFSFENFCNNAFEYFKPVLSPFGTYPAHSAIVIGLGLFGCALWLRWIQRGLRLRAWHEPRLRFALFVGVWLILQAIIVFTYAWGRAQYPSAARLVIAIDTFFSFAAAWVMARALARFRPFIAVLLAAAVLLTELPIASQHRMLNRLTQTRENATTWRFFASLHEKRILIVTDHPNLYTIMDYGAMSFETAKQDRFLFDAFARHLFYDVYLVQQVELSTNRVLPEHDIWPTRKLETMLELQNDANVAIRISRLAHESR